MNKLALLFSLSFALISNAQNFHPTPSLEGSIAIHKDSSAIVAWATGITVQRGLKHFEDPSQGYAAHGVPEDGVGAAEGNSMDVVSLGDSGVAILTFDVVIENGPGYDFAVFENGFSDDYIELAFVEVSSDGINFVRFNATSEANIDIQIGNFETTDCRLFNNLAGKYRQGFGTPFDLDELKDSAMIDVNHITHVKLVDVIGSIDPLFGSVDGQGKLINDPYPSVFEACGFDLDGVAVMNMGPVGIESLVNSNKIFPNPAKSVLNLKFSNDFQCNIFSLQGEMIYSATGKDQLTMDVSAFNAGIYLVEIIQNNQRFIEKVVIVD